MPSRTCGGRGLSRWQRNTHGPRSRPRPCHHHAPASYDRAFALGIGLNLAYVAVEAVFGLLAGSLALLADAGHNLSDVLGLGLAWGAAWLARRAAHAAPHLRPAA